MFTPYAVLDTAQVQTGATFDAGAAVSSPLAGLWAILGAVVAVAVVYILCVAVEAIAKDVWRYARQCWEEV